MPPTTVTPPISSPCINICQMNTTTGLCEGCFRTLDEITRWSAEDELGKNRILAKIEARRDAAFDDEPHQVAAGGQR